MCRPSPGSNTFGLPRASLSGAFRGWFQMVSQKCPLVTAIDSRQSPSLTMYSPSPTGPWPLAEGSLDDMDDLRILHFDNLRFGAQVSKPSGRTSRLCSSISRSIHLEKKTFARRKSRSPVCDREIPDQPSERALSSSPFPTFLESCHSVTSKEGCALPAILWRPEPVSTYEGENEVQKR